MSTGEKKKNPNLDGSGHFGWCRNDILQCTVKSAHILLSPSSPSMSLENRNEIQSLPLSPLSGTDCVSCCICGCWLAEGQVALGQVHPLTKRFSPLTSGLVYVQFFFFFCMVTHHCSFCYPVATIHASCFSKSVISASFKSCIVIVSRLLHD